MRKKVLSVMLVLTMMGTFIGCGGKENSDDAEKESNSGETGETGGGESKEGETVKLKAFLLSEDEARLRAYNEYYEPNVKADLPNYDVEFELPGKGYQEKLRIYNASGELPDVFFGWNVILESENAVNLTPYIEADGFVDRYKTDSALIPYSDGNIYALSAGTDAYYTAIMLYNKDIFEEENLEVPTSYEELLAVSKEFAARDYVPISMFGGFSGYAFMPQELITMNNPENMEKIVSGELGFDSEPFKEAMGQFEELIQAGAFAKDVATQNYDDSLALFTSGKSPMFYTPLWAYASCEDMENIDWFSLVSFDKTPSVLSGWGQAYGGYMVSKNSEHIEDAIKLAEWMVEQDAKFFSEEMGNAVGIDLGKDPELPVASKEIYDLFNKEETKVIPNFASNYLADAVKAEMEVNIGKFLTSQINADEFCTIMAEEQNK